MGDLNGNLNKEAKGKQKMFQLEGGDVCVWIEQETIFMRAHDQRYPSDPAELTAEMARTLADRLIEMIKEIDD